MVVGQRDTVSPTQTQSAAARRILDQRYARGEIAPEEHQRRWELLS